MTILLKGDIMIFVKSNDPNLERAGEFFLEELNIPVPEFLCLISVFLVDDIVNPYNPDVEVLGQTHSLDKTKQKVPFIRIDIANKGNVIMTLAHEMVHVKQILEKKLKLEGGVVYWEEGNSNRLAHEAYTQSYFEDMPPWEKEAFTLQGPLYMKWIQHVYIYT